MLLMGQFTLSSFNFHNKKKIPVHKKGQGWEPIFKTYKAIKILRTHVTKEQNNKDPTDTLIK